MNLNNFGKHFSLDAGRLSRFHETAFYIDYTVVARLRTLANAAKTVHTTRNPSDLAFTRYR